MKITASLKDWSILLYVASLELFSAQSMQKKVSSVKVDVGAVINEASLATLSGKSKLPLVM